jgi:peptidoglycan hydrolase-like protein with peptidoglycan-binding domain
MPARVLFLGNGWPDREWYQTSHDVFPKIGSPDPTDVMLIQFLLRQFFLAPYVGQRKEFWCLHDKAIKGGKRWDDGIYGPNTREGIRLFEVASSSPYKDGIVRPFPLDADVFVSEYGTLTKLGKLNWVFDNAFRSNVHDKQHVIRTVANPALALKLL